jgi:hypothetical protein
MEQSPSWEADQLSQLTKKFTTLLLIYMYYYKIFLIAFNYLKKNWYVFSSVNALIAELNPICHLLALLELTIFSTLVGKGLILI